MLKNLPTSQKIFACIVLLVLCCGGNAWSQTVSGVVSDSLKSPLPGTSILIKGTTIGTTTDANGAYTLTSPELVSSQSVLVFSFIGFKTREITYKGGSTLNVSLQEDGATLNEVVVTALGIKREEKALGYSTQTLNENQMTDARSNNWSAALSGKVAGLSLLSSGAGPLNSSRIKLRGDNSFVTNTNSALIVLDGVPMNTNMASSGVSSAYGAGSGNDVPIDFGNGIADINPDDIESITVLKGPSAAALYGSRGGHGAIIITTKSGARKNKGLGVTINSNISFNDVLKWPDYQYEYGQGTGKAFNTNGEMYYSYGATADGASTGGTSSAFGPKFNGQEYYQYDPATEGTSAERLPWKPYKDNVKGFWRTGSTVANSISIEGGNDKGSARASITHTKNEWIMPNTGYERINAAFSANYKVSDKIRIASKINYTNKKSDNLPATGYNNQSISYFMIFQNPNVDLKWYEPRWKKDKYQVDQIHPFSSFIDNPYVIAYDMTNSVVNNGIVGNISATYEISKKFEVLVRTSLTMNQEEREQRRPYSTANFQKGYYKVQNIGYSEMNSDFLLTYKDKLSDRFDIRISAGGNTMKRNLDQMNAYVEGLVIPALYKLSNGVTTPMVSTIDNDKMINSFYGLAALSFDDKIFVDLTARNDWSSTLPSQYNSYFYPSISSSFILSEIFTLPSIISYAKLRLAVASVGSDGDPYQTSKYYDVSEFPGSGSAPTTLYNAKIKPELNTNYEAGLEYMMFERRVGLNLTVYRNLTTNHIVPIPIDPTTGFSRAVINAGEVRNQGVEVVLNGTPVRTPGFSWNTTITWAKNYNKVLSLPAELGERMDLGTGGNATIAATVGGTTGDVYGFGFLRAPDGQIIYNSSGLPARPETIQYIGNAYADWKGGVLNEFTYKNFRFNFLIDGQYGGIIYSQTHHKMSEQGKLKSTLMGREEGYIIGKGVVANGDGTYSPNTTQVQVPDYYADYYRRANVESNSFDASYVKLREVRFEYSLPKSLLSRTPLNAVSVALYGRDLAMITKFPMFDPETAALNGSTLLPGVEIGQMPTPRTYGVNVTLKL
ncbi:SusC/RagA family TonB-linked outer membrane protein [Fulvivirgaceae bacterium PWU4]|uniref:SusC/RagA family TonB-linked outer membrane protein n=1 Tax=Chryseosolibacter histidini TaxID=2782349 RepID=A0AAP2DNW5_9BACT|nr:SusC/RagA family TonB-linked outer membrane protein [Chryseosolibacter histidini]MBT1699746.1 SusC/RagA family TonB-linked outer membrane protein [Chryseosolibacter histidini]